MPYTYLANPALCFDAWVVRKLATDDFSRDRWSFQSTISLVRESQMQPVNLLRSAKKWEIVDVEEPEKPEGLFSI